MISFFKKKRSEEQKGRKRNSPDAEKKAAKKQPKPQRPNLRGTKFYPPGHFYSPLLDIEAIEQDSSQFVAEDSAMWDEVPLWQDEQEALYRALVSAFPQPNFATNVVEGVRYYSANEMFPASDAFTLSAMIRHTKPSRIIEVGSGFSSAVMLDTLDEIGIDCQLTFVEPYPDRLNALLRESDRPRCTIFEKPVQAVDPAIFATLKEGDILFIDSSHVAKVGSDVSYLFLKILPRLNKGVIVHVHDIFHPVSYPLPWMLEGRAWNESLFLRAFLVCNSKFRVTAFNHFAFRKFPFLEELLATCPRIVGDGGSFWMTKVE